MTSSTIETVLRDILTNEGHELSPPRSNGQTGVDILARKDALTWHIETIAYKKQGPSRAKDFFESFFRAVSRLNDGAVHCVIALAAEAKTGLPARAKQHRIAWKRIGAAFPELEIWLVNVQSKTLSRHRWDDWLKEPLAAQIPSLEQATAPAPARS